MGQAFYRRAPLELEKLPLKRFRPEEKKWNGVLCRNEEGGEENECGLLG